MNWVQWSKSQGNSGGVYRRGRNVCNELEYPGTSAEESILCQNYGSPQPMISESVSVPDMRGEQESAGQGVAPLVVDISDDSDSGVGGSQNNGSGEVGEDQMDPRPYKCRLCDTIFQLVEEAHYHYYISGVHFNDKATMCLLDDEEGESRSSSAMSEVSENTGLSEDDVGLEKCQETFDDEDGEPAPLNFTSVPPLVDTISPPPEDPRQMSPMPLLPPLPVLKPRVLYSDTIRQSSGRNSDSDSIVPPVEAPLPKQVGVVKPQARVHQGPAVQPSSSKASTPAVAKKRGRPAKFKTKVAPLNLKTQTPSPSTKDAPVPKPADLFLTSIPLKTPYFPQFGDEIILFPHAYRAFVQRFNHHTIGLKAQKPVLEKEQKSVVTAVVNGIFYKNRGIPPSTQYIMRILVESPTPVCGETEFDFFWCNKANPDFVVLKQFYDKGCEARWLVGDEFRSLVNLSWWSGQIVNLNNDDKAIRTNWQRYEIQWKSGDSEMLSPWDLEPVDPSRKPKSTNSGLPLYYSELTKLQYKCNQSEWPLSQKADSDRLANGFEKILSIRLGQVFDKLQESYTEQKTVYAINVSHIIDRLRKRFYRRLTAVKYDLNCLQENIKTVFKSDEASLEKAMDAVKQMLNFLPCNSVSDMDILLKGAFNEEDLEPSKRKLPNTVQARRNSNETPSKKGRKDSEQSNTPSTSGSNNNNNNNSNNNLTSSVGDMVTWPSDCQAFFQHLICQHFAQPFIKPVDGTAFPDYYNRIQKPMWIEKIQAKLDQGQYQSPEEVKEDLNQIYWNSRTYNQLKSTEIYQSTTTFHSWVCQYMKTILDNYNSVRRELKKRAVNYAV